MNSENDIDKENMPLFPSPEPKVGYFNDLDFLKDFENEFPAIVHNDALTSKSDSSTEPDEIPHRIDEFNWKTETSLFECDEKEQNILYFNDLFPFNAIHPDDLKSDKDNGDDKIDIKEFSRGNVINTDVGAYAQGADITRITKKEPKPDKNGHENGKSTQESDGCGKQSTAKIIRLGSNQDWKAMIRGWDECLKI
nr:hypothetical protein [Tanacetum cinerariifolium]